MVPANVAEEDEVSGAMLLRGTRRNPGVRRPRIVRRGLSRRRRPLMIPSAIGLSERKAQELGDVRPLRVR